MRSLLELVIWLGNVIFIMKNDYIEIAAEAITKFIETGEKIKIISKSGGNEIKKGVFVSLKKQGQLRGCIGTVRGRFPIEEEIVNNAIAAATEDPRFYPVSIDELDDLDISVDILVTEEDVFDLSELDPKIYGIIVEQGYRKGLLLPNIDGINSAKKQINIAKEKAGIVDGDFNIKRFKVTRYERM